MGIHMDCYLLHRDVVFLLLIGKKNFFEKVTAHFMNICPLDCEGIETSSLPFNERSSSYGSSL